jgi:hypothetical protein
MKTAKQIREHKKMIDEILLDEIKLKELIMEAIVNYEYCNDCASIEVIQDRLWREGIPKEKTLAIIEEMMSTWETVSDKYLHTTIFSSVVGWSEAEHKPK